MAEFAAWRAVGRVGMLISCRHISLAHTRNLSTNHGPMMSYFSVTRAMLGRSEEEMERDHGIPDIPPLLIYHSRLDIKCSPSKMNLVARQVRNLTITEALKQLEFSPKQAALTVKEVLEEAQKMAVTDYGIDDKNHLFINQAYVGNGLITKKIRYHARGRIGIIHHRHCNLYVILQEGDPLPKPTRRRQWKLTELEKLTKSPKRIRNSLAWW